MEFFRYISYVDYYESGIRIRNAGFLRWKIRDNKHQAELQIKDGPMVNGEYFLMEEKSRKILGTIFLNKGEGSFHGEYQGRYLGETGIDSTTMQALQIELGQGRYLRVRVELPKVEVKPTVAVAKVQERASSVIEEQIQKSEPLELSGKEPSYKHTVEVPKEEPKPIEVKMPELEKESMESKTMDSTSSSPEIEKPLSENKWHQLCSMFPVVHPFPSGRPFVSITPKDFIVLREAYQKLVQNSFLLHGFYNYQHMILGQLEDKEETPYYLGVPGVYYERERQAAQMFGFVGFEGSEQPIQSGSFGYYMIPVEI